MTNYKLQIPKPCHESWNAMSPDEKGRFCSSCEKKVHDFSNASDGEIISVLKSSSNICGRFRESQLKRDLVKPRETSVLFPYLASGILGMLAVASAEAQQKPNVQAVILVGQPLEEVVPDTIHSELRVTMGDVSIVEEDDFFTIAGTVSDASYKLPGVIVTNSNLKNQTSTDIDGNYKIEVRKGDQLTFSYIGYNELTFTVGDSKVCDVNLRESQQLMGEVVVVKENIFKRTYRRIRNWFR